MIYIQAVIGGTLANLYVASINQLSDVDIDKINKPHLPLASGELSIETGTRLTFLYAILVRLINMFYMDYYILSIK